jgi:hypothetical protein
VRSLSVIYFQYRAALVMADRTDNPLEREHFIAEANALRQEAMDRANRAACACGGHKWQRRPVSVVFDCACGASITYKERFGGE